MSKYFYYLLFIAMVAMAVSSCQNDKKMNNEPKNDNKIPPVAERLKAFAPVDISADMSALDEHQKKVVTLLCEAGKIADQIYWKQNSFDGAAIRDSLEKVNTPEAKTLLKYLKIWYGPYDAMYDETRFAGTGAEKRPVVGGYYPQDITKAEFEKYVTDNPGQKKELESQYTVVVRDGNKLKAVPFHEAYPEIMKMADLIEEASKFADNPSLKKYLELRAKALRTDDYYESDMAWMDIQNSPIDVVIGPIENYTDALFNYKTAFECVVMVRDKEATKELEMFESNINNFEHNLPYDKKYIRESAGKGNILQIVNVAYAGGDCNGGTKTIAASLPNDPKVTDAKGGKKSMYKNIMEAKFDKIVVPIAQKILAPDLIPLVYKKAFTSFVTLHEVSHTLGRGFVYGNDTLQIRRALKEKYSAIEELKADILGMYNHKYLLENKFIDADYMKKTIATYIAGLYRSVRFGAEEAHGKANQIQLNFLRATGAITKDAQGKYSYDDKIFMVKVAELAKMALTIEAEGSYQGAVDLIAKYGSMSDETKDVLSKMTDIPRDIDTQK